MLVVVALAPTRVRATDGNPEKPSCKSALINEDGISKCPESSARHFTLAGVPPWLAIFNSISILVESLVVPGVQSRTPGESCWRGMAVVVTFMVVVVVAVFMVMAVMVLQVAAPAWHL